jgi:hypothetical protein
VGRLLFRRTHTSSENEGSSFVIETLPRSDSKTVSVDSHFQEVIQRQSLLIATDNTTVVAYLQNQGGTHSSSLYLLCRESMLLCDNLQTVLTVRHVPGNPNLIADALSRFCVPVNTV